MASTKETARRIARALGVYEQVRDLKDLGFRTLRDWDPLIKVGLRRLAGGDRSELERLSKEFDESGMIERLQAAVAAERAADPDYLAGVSSPLNLRVLYVLCRSLKPRIAVETGVASGSSAFVLLSAMEKNGVGRLYSIDLPPAQWGSDQAVYRRIDRVSLPGDRRPGWLIPEKLRGRWELILGDAKQEIWKLAERLGRIDLFYHDAEHTREAMLSEYKAVWPRLTDGGVLASDDVGWNTAFDEFAGEVGPGCPSGRWFGLGIIRKERHAR